MIGELLVEIGPICHSKLTYIHSVHWSMESIRRPEITSGVMDFYSILVTPIYIYELGKDGHVTIYKI